MNKLFYDTKESCCSSEERKEQTFGTSPEGGEKAERGRVQLMKAVGRGSGSTELSLSECSSGKGAESRQRRVQSSKDQGPMTMSGLVSRVPATTVVGAPSLRGY